MDKVFVYGVPAKGDNFIDRVQETKRLKMAFECGLSSIIVSPRGLGSTSLVKHVISEVKGNSDLITVYMDIYDCRSEYDFYVRFATAIIEQTTSNVSQWIENANEFLSPILPHIYISAEPSTSHEVTLSFGKSIKPDTHSPERILNLPERLAKKLGKHIIVCIDEFQMIGQMRDSLTIQKRMRTMWQHQDNCSYCFIGSKELVMTDIFQNRHMPLYKFGDIMYLKSIPTEDWVSYIQRRFESRCKLISSALCERLCEITQNRSSYVQQLAWNVFVQTDTHTLADEQSLENGFSYLMAQCHYLFQEKISQLTLYQKNMLRAIASNVHTGFTSKFIIDIYNLGTKSNISRLKSSLIEKELIESDPEGLYFADPIFKIWIAKNVKL